MNGRQVFYGLIAIVVLQLGVLLGEYLNVCTRCGPARKSG